MDSETRDAFERLEHNLREEFAARIGAAERNLGQAIEVRVAGAERNLREELTSQVTGVRGYVDIRLLAEGITAPEPRRPSLPEH